MKNLVCYINENFHSFFNDFASIYFHTIIINVIYVIIIDEAETDIEWK